MRHYVFEYRLGQKYGSASIQLSFNALRGTMQTDSETMSMNRGGDPENFQPIPVKAPSASRVRFFVRRFLDLQLDTIARPLRTTLSTMPLGHNIRFLDIGAGESPWREWLPEDARYTALEVGHVGHFKMSVAQGDIVLYDGTVMPFADSTFDGALCIEVMEHAADPELLLREAARCLVDRGFLVLTVPWSARRHHIPFDFHRFTRERLEIMLTEAGFEFVAIQERGNDWGAIANKLVVAMMRLLVPRGRGNFIWSVPIAVILAPLVAVALVVAHVSE